MVIFRSLKTLIRNHVRCHEAFLSRSAIPHYSFSLFPAFPVVSPRSRFFYHLIQWTIPFNVPIFYFSPPLKLSYSDPPPFPQWDALLLQNVEFLGPKSGACKVELSSSTLVWFNEIQRENTRREGVTNGRGCEFASNFINFPNIISMTRMASGPFIAWMITNEWYLSAFWGLGISGATDWLDGYVARKMRINSVVGSYLDPLADKVLIGSVALAMVHQNLLHPGLVGLVIGRDVALVCAAFYKRGSSLDWQWESWCDYFNLDGPNPQKVEPLFISKLNTVFQLVLIGAALLEPEFRTDLTQSYITWLSWVVALTTVASSAAYGIQQMRRKAVCS